MIALATSLVTIFGMWLVSQKDWRGWLVGILNQMLWLVLIIQTEAWGLLLLTGTLLVIYTRALVSWRRESTTSGARRMIGRRVATVAEITQPGDYCGPIKGYTGDRLACLFLKPNARDDDAPPCARSLQHVAFPPHTYRECDDGSLEIRASIGDTATSTSRDGQKHTRESDGWHGFLDEGHVWRKE